MTHHITQFTHQSTNLLQKYFEPKAAEPPQSFADFGRNNLPN